MNMRRLRELVVPIWVTIAVVAVFLFLLLWGERLRGVIEKGNVPVSIIATTSAATSTKSEPVIVTSPHLHYIEIIDGCGPYYDTGICVNVRSGPGLTYPVIAHLRTGVVLKVEGTTAGSGLQWYKVAWEEGIRYPERITSDWYVAALPGVVDPLEDVGEEYLTKDSATTSKRIIVDLSDDMLYAYDGDTLFMQQAISPGLEITPTPMGTFRVFKKTPSRYMQGPIPEVSDQYYDLPGVPWNLYFTAGGAVIHGAYWHDHFGSPWSHGCVNLPPEKAKELYFWADIGTKVTVRP